MFRRILAAGTTAAVIAIVLPSLAQAAPTSDSAAVAATSEVDGKHQRIVGEESLSVADLTRQRAQEPLLHLNNRIYDVASQSYDEQFAGTQIEVQNKALVLYWVGKVPTELADLRDEAAKSDVNLVIRPAKFSRQQLTKAAEQVMPTAEVRGSVELAVDGSGITVSAQGLTPAIKGLRTATAAQSRLMQRIEATRRAGIPVTLATSEPAAPQFRSTIWADSSPYWAGAQFNTPTLGGLCTSGFSMYASGSPTTRFTLTAAHCVGFTDGIPVANGANTGMGVSDFVAELYGQNTAYDLAVVRLSSGSSNAPFIYKTANSNDGGIPVSGYASGGIPSGGNYCVHALSAVNCNLISGAQRRDCSGSWCLYTIRMRAKVAGTQIWCAGDSGGPIYYWSGSSVIAAGIVSWGNAEFGNCDESGGASVVASAVNRVPGLSVVTPSNP